MKKYLIKKTEALRKLFIKCWLYFFCKHKWKFNGRSIYNVLREDKTKQGEVTITFFKCERCGKDKLISSDRTHEKR